MVRSTVFITLLSFKACKSQSPLQFSPARYSVSSECFFWDTWQQLYWHTVLYAECLWKEIDFEINKVWFYNYYLLIYRQRKWNFEILVNPSFQPCNTPKDTPNSRPVSLLKTVKPVVDHISGVLHSVGKIASYSLST